MQIVGRQTRLTSHFHSPMIMYLSCKMHVLNIGCCHIWCRRHDSLNGTPNMYKVSLDRDLLLYSSMHFFFCSFSICLSALFPRSYFCDFLFIVQIKNVTHILSLFIVTVTIMASCRCRCRRWQCCFCCGGCCRRRLQSHAKWITFSLLSESSRFFIVH